MKKIFFVSIFFFLISAVFISSAFSEQRRVKVAATEWQPYMSEELPNYGIIPRITKAVFSNAGYEIDFAFYPWPRLIRMTEKGYVDAAIGVSYKKERTEFFRYPDETLFVDRKVILYNKKMEVIQTFTGNLEELCPDTVGVMLGSYLQGLLNKVGCLKVEATPSVAKNFRKLVVGRYKYLLASETTIKLILTDGYFDGDDLNTIGIYDKPVDMDKNYAVFSKRAMENKPYLSKVFHAFDKSLQEMKKDGRYRKLLGEYGF